jgi:enamine deaminase RidA (YjgF/YER057c/UK114 family)
MDDSRRPLAGLSRRTMLTGSIAGVGTALAYASPAAAAADPAEPTAPGAGTYENGSPHITTTGSWTTLSSPADSGGSISYSTSTRASAALTFTGTSVSWISRRTPSSGTNEVWIDDALVATIDRYSPITRSNQTVWSSGTLPAGTHTITLKRGSTKNPAATGSTIILDAFLVEDTPAPTTPPGAGTYEHGSPHITTTGSWTTLSSPADSGGSISYSTSTRASAALTFTGTSVSWISRRTPSSGTNEVWIDDALVATIDRYSPITRSNQTVWSSGTLPAGTHTITLKRGSTKNPAATGSTIILDAFLVEDTPAPPQTPVPAPIADWSFTENAAPYASAVAGAPALLQGASSTATRISTPFGGGVRFNGTTDFLVVPKSDIGVLNVGASTGAVTVAAWVLSTDSNNANIAGIWEESAVGPLRSYALFNDLPDYGGDDMVCMEVSKQGGPTPGYPFSIDYSSEPRKMTRGVWELHVGTYDGELAIAYLNGESTSYPSYTDKQGATYAKNPYVYPDGLNAAPGDFMVGAVGRDGKLINLHKGSIARLRVWDRALTADEVRALHAAERADLG